MSEGVSDGQKAAMAAIMAALNGTKIDNAALAGNPGGVAPIGPTTSEPGSDEAKKAAMGDIMKMFREATDNVRETAQNDHYLMEALQTHKTDTGVRIAEWEIEISEVAGRPGKFYDITHTSTGSRLASDLRLYEAALLLTKELNKGESITGPRIRQILKLEEEFAKNLEDAGRYARIGKTATGDKKVIAEARYSDAKAKAISAKEQIKRIS